MTIAELVQATGFDRRLLQEHVDVLGRFGLVESVRAREPRKSIGYRVTTERIVVTFDDARPDSAARAIASSDTVVREFERCIAQHADPGFHSTAGVRFRHHSIQHFTKEDFAELRVRCRESDAESGAGYAPARTRLFPRASRHYPNYRLQRTTFQPVAAGRSLEGTGCRRARRVRCRVCTHSYPLVPASFAALCKVPIATNNHPAGRGRTAVGRCRVRCRVRTRSYPVVPASFAALSKVPIAKNDLPAGRGWKVVGRNRLQKSPSTSDASRISREVGYSVLIKSLVRRVTSEGFARSSPGCVRLCLTDTPGFNLRGISTGPIFGFSGFDSPYRYEYDFVSPHRYSGADAGFGPSAIRQTQPRRFPSSRAGWKGLKHQRRRCHRCRPHPRFPKHREAPKDRMRRSCHHS